MMDTRIGRSLDRAPRHLALASCVGSGIVIADLFITWRGWSQTPYRLGFLVAALVVYGRLSQWDSDSLGLTMRPIQSFGYWVKATVLIGLAMLGVLLAGVLAYKVMGRPIGLPQRAPDAKALSWFYFACINAPLMEEIVYRFILCVPATAVLRPWGAILVSGTAFAALHVAAGRASPDNLVAGYILAWAYLRSGSLFIPILLHALGNGSLFLAGIAAWYWAG